MRELTHKEVLEYYFDNYSLTDVLDVIVEKIPPSELVRALAEGLGGIDMELVNESLTLEERNK